jgi:hypothetical protein
MKAIGVFASIMGLMVVAFGTLLLIRSIPEIRRYLNIRNM